MRNRKVFVGVVMGMFFFDLMVRGNGRSLGGSGRKVSKGVESNLLDVVEEVAGESSVECRTPVRTPIRVQEEGDILGKEEGDVLGKEEGVGIMDLQIDCKEDPLLLVEMDIGDQEEG